MCDLRVFVVNDSVRKWLHGLSIYNRYGLYTDDILDEDHNPAVREAVRRLPPDLYDGRTYRSLRAFQLDIEKKFLPKEQWTKFEDPMNHYLQPYIKDVEAEWKEKDEWHAKYPQP